MTGVTGPEKPGLAIDLGSTGFASNRTHSRKSRQVTMASLTELYRGISPSVNRITGEQCESHALRKGMTVPKLERWLSPN